MPKEDSGKIRVVVFELEGNNETLREGMRTIASAITRQAMPQRTTQPVQSSENGHAIVATPTQTIMDILEDNEPIASLPPAPSAKKNNKRKYYSPKVLDIDLNSGERSFEDFCKEKNPTTTTDRYLVIAVWLKRYRAIEVLTTDHVYTCFKTMGWGVQRDMSQPLRSAKAGGYMDSTGHGDYKINHIGEGKIDKMG